MHRSGLSLEHRTAKFPAVLHHRARALPLSAAAAVERKIFTHLIGSRRRAAQQPIVAGRVPAQPEHRLPAGLRRLHVLRVGAGRGRTRSNGPPASAAPWRAIATSPANRSAAKATSEQYSLFRAYIDSRHGDGGMVDMTVLDFSAMVDDSFVNSRIVEYRLPSRHHGRRRGPLVAAVLTDRLDDGLSMIYSFYDPELAGRGLGTFMILDHMQRRATIRPALSLSRLLGRWFTEDETTRRSSCPRND